MLREAETGKYVSGKKISPNMLLKKVTPWKGARQQDSGVSASSVDQIIDRATEVIGERQEALRWLGTPVRGLGYATPISLLGNKEGAQWVDDLLGQIEHGIW